MKSSAGGLVIGRLGSREARHAIDRAFVSFFGERLACRRRKEFVERSVRGMGAWVAKLPEDVVQGIAPEEFVWAVCALAGVGVVVGEETGYVRLARRKIHAQREIGATRRAHCESVGLGCPRVGEEIKVLVTRPGLRGLKEALRVHEDVVSVVADVVYAGDQFGLRIVERKGRQETVFEHKPVLERERVEEEMVACYCQVELQDGRALPPEMRLLEVQPCHSGGRAVFRDTGTGICAGVGLSLADAVRLYIRRIGIIAAIGVLFGHEVSGDWSEVEAGRRPRTLGKASPGRQDLAEEYAARRKAFVSVGDTIVAEVPSDAWDWEGLTPQEVAEWMKEAASEGMCRWTIPKRDREVMRTLLVDGETSVYVYREGAPSLFYRPGGQTLERLDFLRVGDKARIEGMLEAVRGYRKALWGMANEEDDPGRRRIWQKRRWSIKGMESALEEKRDAMVRNGFS